MDETAASVFILDDQGTVISDADKTNIGKNIRALPAVEFIFQEPPPPGEGKSFTVRLDGAVHSVSCWRSDLNGWYYCSIVPAIALKGRMNVILFMTIGLTILFFGLTTAFSYPLAKRLNNPVKKMAFRLEDYDLLRLLSGEYDAENIRGYKDLFPKQYFCCVVVSPDRYTELARQYGSALMEERKKELLKICFDALPQEFIHRGLVLERNCAVLVVNFDIPLQDGLSGIQNALRKIQEDAAGRFGFSLSIGIGKPGSIEEVYASYKSARRALLHRLVLGYGCLIVYEEEPVTKYSYPMDLEKKIFNYLRLNNLEKAQVALNDFFMEIKKHPELSMDNVILAFNQLGDGIIKYIIENYINLREIFDDDINLYYRFSDAETIDEIERYYRNVLKKIIRIESRASELSETPIKKILSYIHTNSDKTFDLQALSESVGLCYSHVRRIFKENMGENILAYVYKLKVNRAKKMLRNTDLPVETIAKQLGFYNRQSFYRFFEKFEGITPPGIPDHAAENHWGRVIRMTAWYPPSKH
jgi:AraC-like DNA-binding protein